MKYILSILLLCIFINHASYAVSAHQVEINTTEHFQKKINKKRQLKKRSKKALKAFSKMRATDPETKKEKKKLPFGAIALLSLLGIPLGVLIGTGIGNLFIFAGWFMAVLFGIRGMKRDENKFLGLIALAIAVGLLISTFTFLDGGLVG